MKTLISTILACLFSVQAFAVIGIEYELPSYASSWTKKNELDNENGSMKIFMPTDTSSEFFGVNINKFPADLDNIAAIKEGLAFIFPHMDINVAVLEKNNDSVIYEWGAKEADNEKTHGWGKLFAIKDGSAALCYQTSDLSKLDQNRLDWVPVLQKAKAMEQLENDSNKKNI